MRRDQNDGRWSRVKEGIRSRDGGICRLLSVLTYKEALFLKKKAGPMLGVLDPAHYLPVSKRPDLCYDPYNIVLLNRYSHECLDDFRNPVTGAHITAKEVNKWWVRILESNLGQIGALQQRGLVEVEKDE